jgi:hypothetical protein
VPTSNSDGIRYPIAETIAVSLSDRSYDKASHIKASYIEARYDNASYERIGSKLASPDSRARRDSTLEYDHLLANRIIY